MFKMRCERDDALERLQAMELKLFLSETRTRKFENHLTAQVNAVREMVAGLSSGDTEY
jgi:hypothetical protein